MNLRRLYDSYNTIWFYMTPIILDDSIWLAGDYMIPKILCDSIWFM